MSSDAERIAAAIPAEFHMISGSQDKQTSADVFNTGKVSSFLSLALAPACRSFIWIVSMTPVFYFWIVCRYLTYRSIISFANNIHDSSSSPILLARLVEPAPALC